MQVLHSGIPLIDSDPAAPVRGTTVQEMARRRPFPQNNREIHTVSICLTRQLLTLPAALV